jgi:hypothetical protein
MRQPEPFTCRDCGTRVYRYVAPAANDQNICVECTWLRDIEDPDEREKLRAWLAERRP